MLWVAFAYAISVVASFLLGYHVRNLSDRVQALEEVVKSKVDKPVEPEEPPSSLVDPLDPIQTAIFEREQMMRKLNGPDNTNN